MEFRIPDPGEAEAETAPRGGTYTLRDPTTGEVMRSGRTNNMCRREGEHGRDDRFSHLDFNPENKTDDYNEQQA